MSEQLNEPVESAFVVTVKCAKCRDRFGESGSFGRLIYSNHLVGDDGRLTMSGRPGAPRPSTWTGWAWQPVVRRHARGSRQASGAAARANAIVTITRGSLSMWSQLDGRGLDLAACRRCGSHPRLSSDKLLQMAGDTRAAGSHALYV